MKKLILSGAALAALVASPVLAADLPVKAPILKAPVVAVYNWSGCYFGGYVGGAFNSERVRTTDPLSVTAPPFFYNAAGGATAANGGIYSYDLDSSVIGGGTLGCNWQASGSAFVFGLEAEGGYMRLSRTVVDPFSAAGPPFVFFGGDTRSSTRVGDWDAVFAGRLGWASDRVLFYVKGGGGITDVRASVVDACNIAPCGPATLTAVGNANTRAFWVAGGGIEWAWTNQWSIKAEYLFLGLNETVNACGLASTGFIFCAPHKVDGIHTAKVGLNYHFNWGGPVTARY